MTFNYFLSIVKYSEDYPSTRVSVGRWQAMLRWLESRHRYNDWLPGELPG